MASSTSSSASSGLVKLFDFKDTQDFSKYWSQVKTTAASRGLGRFFEDPYVPRVDPAYVPPGATPAGMTQGEWNDIHLKKYQHLLIEIQKETIQEDENWIKSTAIMQMHLGPDPLKTIERSLVIVDGFQRFTAVKDILREKYSPSGDAAASGYINKIMAVDDALGISHMVETIQEYLNSIANIDPAKVPSQSMLKGTLCSNVKRDCWKQYCILKLDDDAITYDIMSAAMCKLTKSMPGLESDINSSAASVAMVVNPMSSSSSSVTCWNCNGSGHVSSNCPILTCRYCQQTWANANSPGRHTYGSCPKRINANSVRGGRNGGRGGRGGGAGRFGARFGGRNGGRGRGNSGNPNPPPRVVVPTVPTVPAAKKQKTDMVNATLASIVTSLEDINSRMVANGM
jgi:hypothetical protein